jgi:hypothetical protein
LGSGGAREPSRHSSRGRGGEKAGASEQQLATVKPPIIDLRRPLPADTKLTRFTPHVDSLP